MRSDAYKSGRLWIAVTCALASMQAQAVGLGTIEVKSKLAQPFVAEIPLTINSPDEADGLVVRLASPEAFERVGLERPNDLSANLQFTVGKNARGEPVVRVTTPQRMNDPYVSFLLEADWGKGKMVREYTALLDPPHTVSVPRRAISAPTVASTPLPAPMPIVTQPVAAPAMPAPSSTSVETAPAQSVSSAASPVPATAVQSAPIAAAAQPEPSASIAAAPSAEAQPAPIAFAPEPSPAPVAEAASPPAQIPEPAAAPSEPKAAPDAVTVGRGQTLSAIAAQTRPSDMSVNRMMIALQRANPDAFIHDNINLLKSGAVLRIPGSEQTHAVTAAEANALVHEQVESWRQGAQPVPQLQPEETVDTKPAAPIKTTASATTATPDHSIAPKIKTAVATHTANKTTSAAQADATVGAPKVSKPRGAHLEIVPPAGIAAANSQSGASEGGSGSELRAQLAQTKEELSARNAEVGDLKSRLADLEKMQQDSSQLLTMKDSQMAAMQQRLAELEKTSPAASAAGTTASAPATTANAAEAAMPASNTSTTSTPPAPTVVSSASPAIAAVPPAAPATAASTDTTAAQSVEPTPAPTPWYLRPLVLIGGGLLVLAGLLGLMLRRPREAEAIPRQRSFDTGALAASMAAARLGAQPAVSETAASEPATAESAVAERGVDENQHDQAAVAMPSAEHAAAVGDHIAARQPSWTAEHDATPQPPVVPPTDAATPAAIAAPDDDDWAIPGEAMVAPVSAPPATNATVVRPAMPGIADSNQSVATKLELARAYIDIGDNDGARSMLEEVLIQGNATQQEAAFALLDRLDG